MKNIERNIRIPNFFIVGAPKCGTSAMYHYLYTHPNIYFSEVKKPAFWATDYSNIKYKHSFSLELLEDYLKLFEAATDDHIIVAEASTVYLSSQKAIPNILKFNNEARFLVLLRNPVDFVHAFHMQKLFDFNEDVKDFEKA